MDIEAGFPCAAVIFGRSVSGERDEQNRILAKYSAYAPRDFVTFYVRQAEIDQRNIRALVERDSYGARAVGSLENDMSVRHRQQHAQSRAHVAVVFDDEDFQWRSVRWHGHRIPAVN